MRAVIQIFVAVGFSIISYGQDIANLKESLNVLKVEKNGVQVSEKWYYNPQTSEIKHIKTEVLNEILPKYDLYSVFLERFSGWHDNSSKCLVLHDSSNGELKVIEPLWYNGISSDFFQMFINYKFENSQHIQKFIFEFQKVMLIGSDHSKSFKNTVFGDDRITFDLYDFYQTERIWRKIEIGISNNVIKYLASTNPITEQKIIIK